MISVIVPVYNEATVVGEALEELLKELSSRPVAYEVVVVNDGSTDSSGGIVAGIDGVRLVSHRTNKGYGAALKTGIREAKGDVVVTFDADGQHTPTDIWDLVDALEPGTVVIGDRGKKHRSPLWRGPGKWLLGRLVNFLARQHVPDFNSGLRVARREDFVDIMHLCADRFSFSASSTLAFHSQGLHIVSLPIHIRARTGKSSMRVSAACETLLAIIRIAMMFDPLRIFLPAALLPGSIGLIWLVCGLWLRNISDVTVLLIITSCQLLFLGLVADQISQMRKEMH